MTFRRFLSRLLLTLALVLACGALVEGLLRGILFHTNMFTGWRVPAWYTQMVHVNDHVPGSDDRDKLSVRWGLMPVDTSDAHPDLGWFGDLDPVTLLPKGYARTDQRADLVLLGARWRDAQGRSVHPLLDADTALHRRRQLVDLSVPLFGPDQDHMLLRRLLPALDHPLVCLAVDPRDMDLVLRTFNARPKPWYALTPQGLRVMGTPVRPADPDKGTGLATANGSLLFHLLSNRLFGDSIPSISATKSREEGLLWTGLYIFSSLLDSTRAHGGSCVVLIEDRVDGWLMKDRVTRLAERCDMASVPYRLMSELLLEQGTEDPRAAMEREALNWATIPDHLQRVMEWNRMRSVVFQRDEDLNELDRRIKGILMDVNWMKVETRKAREQQVPLTKILLEDARYTLELDKQKK